MKIHQVISETEHGVCFRSVCALVFLLLRAKYHSPVLIIDFITSLIPYDWFNDEVHHYAVFSVLTLLLSTAPVFSHLRFVILLRHYTNFYVRIKQRQNLILYILILNCSQVDEFWILWCHAVPKVYLLIISVWIQFWFIVVVRIFSKNWLGICLCYDFVRHSGDEIWT